MGHDKERFFVEVDGVVFENVDYDCPVCGQPGRTCVSMAPCPFDDSDQAEANREGATAPLLRPFPEDLGPVWEIDDAPSSVFSDLKAGRAFARATAYMYAPLWVALDTLRGLMARRARVDGPFLKTARLLVRRGEALRTRLDAQERLAGLVEGCAFTLVRTGADGLTLTLFTPHGQPLAEIETGRARLGGVSHPRLVRRLRTQGIGLTTVPLLDWRLSQALERLIAEGGAALPAPAAVPAGALPGPAPESAGTLAAAAASLRALAAAQHAEGGKAVLARLADTAERARRLAERFPGADRRLDPLTRHLLPRAVEAAGALNGIGAISRDRTVGDGLLLALEDIAERADRGLDEALAAEAAIAADASRAAIAVHDIIDRRVPTAR